MRRSYIPMRIDLHEDPDVLEIARGLKIPVLMVVGGLHRVWGWFRVHGEGGKLPARLVPEIDRMTSVQQFSAWMRAVGWLCIDEKEMWLPKVAAWMSQDARSRLLSNARQRKRRSVTRDKRVSHASVTRAESEVTLAKSEVVTPQQPKEDVTDGSRVTEAAGVTKRGPLPLETLATPPSSPDPPEKHPLNSASASEEGKKASDAPRVSSAQNEKPRQDKTCQKSSDEKTAEPALAIFDPPSAAPEPKKAPLSASWAAHLKAWNDIAKKHGRLPIKDLHEQRKMKLRGRLAEHPDLWSKVDAAIHAMGDWGREQRFLTFDWLMSPANLTKLLEGNYSRQHESARKNTADPDAHSKALEAERRKIREEIARNNRKETHVPEKAAAPGTATGDQPAAPMDARNRGAREASRGGAGVDPGKAMGRRVGVPDAHPEPGQAGARRQPGGDPLRGSERAGSGGGADRVPGHEGPGGPAAGRGSVPEDKVSGAGR